MSSWTRHVRWLASWAGAFTLLAVPAFAQEQGEGTPDPIVGVWSIEGEQIALHPDGTWTPVAEDPHRDEMIASCAALGYEAVARECVGRWIATDVGYQLSDPHLHNLEGDIAGCGCQYQTAAATLDGGVLTVTPDSEDEGPMVLTRVPAEGTSN